jgi:hypothetical protein
MTGRLTDKVNKIIRECGDDSDLLDERIDEEMSSQEILTLGLLPINSKLRTFVIGCFLRAKDRKKKLDALKTTVQTEDLVPVEVHGGGKCKITLFMTREAVERERGR